MLTRIAAAVLAVAGITGLMTWIAPGGSAVAFAQVQEALDNVRSVTYDATSQWPGEPETKSRILVLSSQGVRIELPEGGYLVQDSKHEKSLWVKEDEKKAIVFTGRPPESMAVVPADLYGRLRSMRTQAVEELPRKTINGTAAAGFRVVDGQQTMQVWIDPATDLPLRIESTHHQGGAAVAETAFNFVFDSELDESLFKTDPPAGYAVETRAYPQPTDSAKTELVIVPKQGLGPARFGMTRDEVIEVLGKPDDSRENDIGGELLRYDTRGFWISIGPDDALRNIACHAHPEEAAPVARTFAGKTSQGIAMGASRYDISKAYGPPNSENDKESQFGKLTTMTYWDLGLTFTLRNDALEEIDVSLPKSAEE